MVGNAPANVGPVESICSAMKWRWIAEAEISLDS